MSVSTLCSRIYSLTSCRWQEERRGMNVRLVTNSDFEWSRVAFYPTGQRKCTKSRNVIPVNSLGARGGLTNKTLG